MRPHFITFSVDEPYKLPIVLQNSFKQSPGHFSDRFSAKSAESRAEALSPEELVDRALKALQDAGIQLIEWLSLLHRRMGVPVIIKDFHYLVPDEQVELASKLLCEDEGLPLSLPPPLLVLDGGDFYVKARMHRVSHDKSLASAQHLVLYPASFADYSPTDLVPMPRYAGLPHPLCKTVLVPSPPAVYASILRMMKAYSRFDPVQIAIQSDLAQLVGYHLYGLDCGYVDMDDEELCDGLEVDRRMDDAVRVVQSWRRTYFVGADDWIGDALEKIVSGRADIEDVLGP